MLSKNVLNPDKKGQIEGRVFHLFYPTLSDAVFFDSDLSIPIIWGSKNVVVVNGVKALDKIMEVPSTTVVRIYSYILDATYGFRRIDTYNGPIDTIGKYIRRY